MPKHLKKQKWVERPPEQFGAWMLEKFPRWLRKKTVSSAKLTGYSTAGFVATILEEWMEDPTLPPKNMKWSVKNREQWLIVSFPLRLKDSFISAAWATDNDAYLLLEWVLKDWFERRRRNNPCSRENKNKETTK